MTEKQPSFRNGGQIHGISDSISLYLEWVAELKDCSANGGPQSQTNKMLYLYAQVRNRSVNDDPQSQKDALHILCSILIPNTPSFTDSRWFSCRELRSAEPGTGWSCTREIYTQNRCAIDGPQSQTYANAIRIHLIYLSQTHSLPADSQ
jgi:hypothetical protein